jgi:hypothetical protein
MVAKVHESFDAGQFLTGSLNHFTISNVDGIDMKHLVETVGTRATVVILGAGGERIAVENNGAWDAAGLQTALGGNYVVADFAY